MASSADLDLSMHSLNKSISKHKFSFPKSERFKHNSTSVCDSYYQIPQTRTQRTTSFGYGNKTLGIRYQKHMPPVGSYDLGSQFKFKPSKGFSFGQGRDEMEIGGPMKDAKLLKYVPGPGNYEIKSSLEQSNITLKSRIPDHSNDHHLKVPGPGAYPHDSIGSSQYYVTSKFKNQTNHKISPSQRLEPINRSKTIQVGPATYRNDRQSINASGKYALSIHQNSKVRVFEKSPRPSLVFKHMVGTPGPGQYMPFSDFGNI